MQGCNCFLPIYEPLVDTFDSIRERSTFAFTVILFVALRVQSIEDPSTADNLWICEQEVRRLAADTLFANPTSLDSTEAMAILAIQSDKNWFALGHAFQMGTDLRLDKSLRGLHANSSSNALNDIPTRKARYDARCARAYRLISHFERAVALGTSRKSRSEDFEASDLKAFLDHGFSRPSDVYFCSSIDLFQTCARFQRSVTLPTIEQVTSDLEAWRRKWDGFYEKDHVHSGSFQRVHLRIQMFQAQIVQAGSLFTGIRLPWSDEERRTCLTPGQAALVSEHTLRTIIEMMTFVDESSAYKWLFKWAPTYEALLLAFVAVFGLKLLSLYPGLAEQGIVLIKIEQAADLLKQHPCQNFHSLVRCLVDQKKSSMEALEVNIYGAPLENNNVGWQQDGFDFTTWPIFRHIT
jgi:hypothetical protein